MFKWYTLSKQDIEKAIVRYIGIFAENTDFFPYRISEIYAEQTWDEELHIPNTVRFRLEMIPREKFEKGGT